MIEAKGCFPLGRGLTAVEPSADAPGSHAGARSVVGAPFCQRPS